jgi:hypothetical protein
MHRHLVVALAHRRNATHLLDERVMRRMQHATTFAACHKDVMFGVMAGISVWKGMTEYYQLIGVRHDHIVFPENVYRQPVTTTLDELHAAFQTANKLQAILVIVTSLHHIPRVLYICRHGLRAFYEPRKRHDQVHVLSAHPLWQELGGRELIESCLELPRLVRTHIMTCAQHDVHPQ